MKYAMQRFNHNLNLACILNNAGIEEVNEIEVNEPEVVRYNRWMRDVVQSHFYSNNHAMSRGYERVANHTIRKV